MKNALFALLYGLESSKRNGSAREVLTAAGAAPACIPPSTSLAVFVTAALVLEDLGAWVLVTLVLLLMIVVLFDVSCDFLEHEFLIRL